MTFGLFVVSIVNAFAWPAAFRLAVTWFRAPLTALLWRLARPTQPENGATSGQRPGGPA